MSNATKNEIKNTKNTSPLLTKTVIGRFGA
jgi:hypothetical protein